MNRAREKVDKCAGCVCGCVVRRGMKMRKGIPEESRLLWFVSG